MLPVAFHVPGLADTTICVETTNETTAATSEMANRREIRRERMAQLLRISWE
jgi:hypothetical protein